MPIYEYHCEGCDADFEQLVRTTSAKARATCPDCGGHKARRKLSLFGMSSSSSSPATRSGGSSCGSCRATSCAGCRK